MKQLAESVFHPFGGYYCPECGTALLPDLQEPGWYSAYKTAKGAGFENIIDALEDAEKVGALTADWADPRCDLTAHCPTCEGWELVTAED